MTPSALRVAARRPAARRLASALLLAAACGLASAQDVLPIDAPALHGAWLVPADPERAADPPRTIAYLVVLAGERDNDGPRGLAHYAEHLVWHSATRGRRDLGDGPDANASTDQWATAYHLDGPSDAIDATLATLARTLDPIELPRAFMTEELGIVEREYDYRVRENVNLALWHGTAVRQHGDAWPARLVAGTPESLARLTPALAKAWAARTHVPGNAVLVVHGEHGRDALAAAVARAFGDGSDGGSSGDVADGPIAPPGYAPGPPANDVHRVVESRLDASRLVQSRVAALPDPVPDARDLLARLAVLEGALDSTRPGGLAGPLRYDDFVAASFGIEVEPVDAGHVELRFDARPDRGVTLETLHARFDETLGSIAEEGVPAASVERARDAILDRFDALERPDEVALDAALDAVAHRLEPGSNAARRARVEAVGPAEVNALVDLLAGAPRTVTVLFEPGETP